MYATTTNREDFTGISGYEDHSLNMLFIWLPEGNLAGVVLAIPCSAQVDKGLTVFSADFWHEIRPDLRQRLDPDLQVLPLCAAAGDQSPHFLIYTVKRNRRCARGTDSPNGRRLLCGWEWRSNAHCNRSRQFPAPNGAGRVDTDQHRSETVRLGAVGVGEMPGQYRPRFLVAS